MRIVLAGGGTAGHIEPALNLADEILRRHPEARITALGTARGLEVDLVPARGYHLELIPAVPLPRRPGADLLTLPSRLRAAVRATRTVIDDAHADVVVGFGGYVAMPAYLAARGRCPVVVHEANARPGLANRLGARWAAAVAQSVPGTLPNAVLTGNPLRESIASLDRAAMRAQARAHFGIEQDARVLLVFGGSQGARRINDAVAGLLAGSPECVVLHGYGGRNEPVAPNSRSYVGLSYIDRMDLAYAAADFAVCRSGAMTVAEVTAVGLPACFVPFPVGNGEQALNGRHVVDAGGALQVDDADLSSAWLSGHVLPLLSDSVELQRMSVASRALGRPQAAGLLADVVERVLEQRTGT